MTHELLGFVDFVVLWRGDSGTVEAIAEHGVCLGRLLAMFSTTETNPIRMRQLSLWEEKNTSICITIATMIQ